MPNLLYCNTRMNPLLLIQLRYCVLCEPFSNGFGKNYVGSLLFLKKQQVYFRLVTNLGLIFVISKIVLYKLKNLIHTSVINTLRLNFKLTVKMEKTDFNQLTTTDLIYNNIYWNIGKLKESFWIIICRFFRKMYLHNSKTSRLTKLRKNRAYFSN